MFDELLCEHVGVAELLDRELARYQKRCGMPEHISISMHVSGSIWADSLWAGKMFGVLIENAFQAMKGEGCLTFEMEKRRGLDVLKIRDSGVGLTESDLKYIFQPFYSLTGRKGMGLALLKASVWAHGGKVWCESRMDVGSIFYVGFPEHKIEAYEAC
jgi:signal transduction histidine kinase